MRGPLDDFVARASAARSPPVVCSGSSARILTPNPARVAAVHVVPVAELHGPEIPLLSAIPESNRPVLSLPIPSLATSTHAPTAAVLYQLREVPLHGRSTRGAHSEQPVLAWS